MPRIPSLPISFQDAIPLLRALNGKGVKGTEISADWNGGLGYKGVEYWVGPSEVDLRLRNEVNNRVMPIWSEFRQFQRWALRMVWGIVIIKVIGAS